ncbi:tautomerase [Brevibacillus reuszeri]|uniref:tautomerase family protein n=1 Tax=Brevibacillus reuszeri TaxID=54915 RepID=UPI001B21C679|nr:4-oxalocrotonate tautomerase family protein [Brevibacillus reuszeri]GIO06617.1 tautomerase [Brevibacillus reuszeri]
MPYINLQITKGATRDQKAQIVKEFTETLVNVLGKKPEHTHIVIEEMTMKTGGMRAFSLMISENFKHVS